jgi:hypothetical protein
MKASVPILKGDVRDVQYSFATRQISVFEDVICVN